MRVPSRVFARRAGRLSVYCLPFYVRRGAQANLSYDPPTILNLAQRLRRLGLDNGVKYGKAQGYSYLDFGLSDWDQEGLLRYKRKFATEEKTISFLRYAPNETSSETVRQLNGLFSQMTDLFTDEAVPDHVTEKAGNVLYRFFC
jgi:hypothetical protein